MISIGKPHVAKELIAHLELQDGENYLFVGTQLFVDVALGSVVCRVTDISFLAQTLIMPCTMI